ncbi:hypothetical protein BJG92_03037 [Arthrobacter sp. SO5]|uniref:DUF6262 family protein n=1 Tax=Arthrobacter sp. SO5 TaxID=1897055 RepID=UPI001E4EBAAC|nr:DUF6262 family protein [Arthrobacter sp. SO5]MCB5273739.1 hypothetical protein [Arthrobacter sp. SO5]MCB5275486.1 hypothetical protein [Arthrobacter sp. SO5]
MNSNTSGIAAARQAHSTRCRQRVLAALEQAVHLGAEISISSIARRAGVDRSFLYRHSDLHAAVLLKAAEPTTAKTGGPSVSRPSLITDLANAHERIARLSRENAQVRQRLSEHLGEEVWRESGLGAPDDVDRLHHRVTELEQHTAEQRRQLSERDDELDAARAANRELMTRLNRPHPDESNH